MVGIQMVHLIVILQRGVVRRKRKCISHGEEGRGNKLLCGLVAQQSNELMNPVFFSWYD